MEVARFLNGVRGVNLNLFFSKNARKLFDPFLPYCNSLQCELSVYVCNIVVMQYRFSSLGEGKCSYSQIFIGEVLTPALLGKCSRFQLIAPGTVGEERDTYLDGKCRRESTLASSGRNKCHMWMSQIALLVILEFTAVYAVDGSIPFNKGFIFLHS